MGSLVLCAACTDIFDYQLADPSAADAATRSDPNTGSAQDEIWRRNNPQSDAGASRTPTTTDAANGVRTEPMRSGEMRGTDVEPDDDAGVGIGPVDPDPSTPDTSDTTEPQPPSAALAQAGWEALTDWTSLPSLRATDARLFSTHERGVATNFPLIDPGNKDFNSFLAVCGDQPALVGQQNEASVSCEPGQVGYLIAADDGPGYVSRILLARGISNPSSSVVVDVRPMNERVRIYIDGAETPVFEGLWRDWADGRAMPFSTPLTGWTSGATVSYLPISYSSQLRVFVDDLTAGSSLTLYYAHVNTHRVGATQSFDAAQLSSREAYAELERLMALPRSTGASWIEQDVVVPAASATSVWTRDQPGTLQRIELQLDAASAPALLREVGVRLSWDGTPAVELPLAQLFGARHTLAPFSTLPLSVEIAGNTAQLRLSLPMPFAQSASLELVNASEQQHQLRVRLFGSDELPPGEWGRLYTAQAELRDPQAGDRFSAAALSGRGKLVGALMYMRGKVDASRSPRAEALGFMEGDERLEIDGQVVALGTGTDNFFNGAFFFRDGPYSAPFSAVSQLAVDEERGVSETTMMRWTILSDELNFQDQLALSFELGADRPATVRDYASVIFYYQ